jgi:hypothetical protein
MMKEDHGASGAGLQAGARPRGGLGYRGPCFSSRTRRRAWSIQEGLPLFKRHGRSGFSSRAQKLHLRPRHSHRLLPPRQIRASSWGEIPLGGDADLRLDPVDSCVHSHHPGTTGMTTYTRSRPRVYERALADEDEVMSPAQRKAAGDRRRAGVFVGAGFGYKELSMSMERDFPRRNLH